MARRKPITVLGVELRPIRGRRHTWAFSDGRLLIEAMNFGGPSWVMSMFAHGASITKAGPTLQATESVLADAILGAPALEDALRARRAA